MSEKGLGELLVREQLITIDQLQKAKREQKLLGANSRISSALVKLGYINENQLRDFLAKQYQVPSIDLSKFEIDPQALKGVSREICEKFMVIPVSKTANTIVVAMVDPSNVMIKDDLQFITRCKIEAVVASETAIQWAIDKFYGQKTTYESIMTEFEKSDAELTKTNFDNKVINFNQANQADAPVIKFVNMMLQEAIKLKASDIHIEPYEKKFRVRFRVDGVLMERIIPPQGISSAVVSRIKIMSQLDISERRRPQDGRLKARTKDGREIDFRISVLPTLFGEKIVMRLLDKTNLNLDISKLGMDVQEIAKYQESIKAPYGMILVTGPTGSGKSTTIYSTLAELNKPDVNISTVEDPVEYYLEGINQVQANADVDLTFAAALRSFLRQDPDVIMVGEIRDYETAEVAFKAALTGHLVVSTLHTNDAPSTINRLINMGVEPFLVTAGVNLVIAQRLVRKICENCSGPVQVDPKLLLEIGFKKEEIGTFQVMQGHGCTNCHEMGYTGRIAIYEIMPFTESLKNLVYQNATAFDIKRQAIKEGMQSLRRSGLNKIKQGLTTIQEVLDCSPGDSA